MIRYSLDERIAHVAAWRCSGLTGRQYAVRIAAMKVDSDNSHLH